MLDTLGSVLKHPTSIGTGLGALGGAGVGFLTSDSDDPNRLRKTLVGAATGAGIGGLTGALTAGTGGRSVSEIDALIQNTAERSYKDGFVNAMNEIKANPGPLLQKIKVSPESVSKLVAKMDESARDALLKQYRQKTWLARMFGG